MKFLTCAFLSVIAVSPAFAQLNSFSLQAKYGVPLDRETFTVRSGVEMVVDYGAGKQVCRIQLPSGKRIVNPQPGEVTEKLMEEVLAEVLPASVRGKEVNRGSMTMGLQSLSFTEYEHVTIGETKSGDRGTGITVRFKDASCPSK